jgi:predicted nucleic acid-binding protein
MDIEHVALDANILIFASDGTSPYFLFCDNLLKKAEKNKIKLYVTDKTLFEFYAVLSKYLFKNDHEKAITSYEYYLQYPYLTILHSTPQTPFLVSELLKKREVKGKYIHDIVLIALLLEHDIPCIYTNNVKDFEGIPGLEVRCPKRKE